jgi:hypothetical protein
VVIFLEFGIWNPGTLEQFNNKTMKTITLLSCSCMIAAALQAQIIYVPGTNNLTIQQGIELANPGDTVLVSDGIYFEQINFIGNKPLMVASEFIIDGDESHISNTIIDGSTIPTSDQMSVVSFVSGEDTTSTICGFTITGGKGTVLNLGNYSCRTGGGVFISNSGGRIIHNHITQNHLSYSLFRTPIDIYRGAGIGVTSLTDTNWVIIENNTVDYNSCTSNTLEASGAGMSIWCNAIINQNVVCHNTSTGEMNSTAYDGGLTCATGLEMNMILTMSVRGNIISNNHVQADNNSAAGGGGAFQHVKAILQDNNISDNDTFDNYIGYGGIGGIAFILPLEGTVVSGNTFAGNTSDAGYGALDFETLAGETNPYRILVENNYFLNNQAERGSALASYNVPVCIQNNVFSGNSASGYGGAMLVLQDITLPVHHMAILINNSFYGNSAVYGGAIFSNRTKPLIVNCIFSNDTASTGPEIFAIYPSDSIEIANSDIDFNLIYGNFEDGSGNINQDPLFEDQVYLMPYCYSACIDNGIPDYTCNHGETYYAPEYDINGEPRPLDGGVDLGAYESCVEVGIQSAVSSQQSAVTCYPNPTHGIVNCQLSVVDCQFVSLKLNDIHGREVAVLVDEYLQAGEHVVRFDATALPAGMYFYQLTGDSKRLTGGKLIKY